VRKLDVFAAVNVALFLVLCVFRYYARFIQYRGIGHIEEFFFYAVVILVGIAVLWRGFRHHEFETLVLVLVELGILMHFAGAFVQVDGGRLYDVHLLGIRYDKYVHFVNAFVVALLMSRLFLAHGIAPTPLHRLLLVLAVLGLGAVVEIMEYAAMLTIPGNGVGGYDNNMQDLVSNACGSLAFLLTGYRSPRQ
jgi:putative membrane protein